MNELNIIAHNFNPNLRILQNYIITYEDKKIKLFDLKANFLDICEFGNIINDIKIINENHLIGISSFDLYIIKINDGHFESKNIIDKYWQKIKDTLYIKKARLLVLSFEDKIEIYEINNLFGEPIQVIFNKSKRLLNFSSNIFINLVELFY